MSILKTFYVQRSRAQLNAGKVVPEKQQKTVTKNVFMTTFLADSTAKTVEKRCLAWAQLRS